ncbi:LysR family transcriptional regulator [Polynucleobacter sp. AP-Kolm-20A-A1]|uniref:LysR family transcriptional regulator n=1 Tax=Polynucleobacter sp. AP-Kolm-20A-A1 TaxID=2081041 RepID=UPI001BFE4C53|nr:LysR family transcriptional regulator [Polynucleobacter sp. AP-Kolm-20A-A1]QWE20161.1 LysR family transcriptional regulator [Polynucleobacter sp. AP-Kolm-20A-A1]
MKSPLNPARVDFVTLKLFCYIVQSGSITKGASQCNLALSAASRRISEFEETVGMALLDRSVKGVTLTHAGHAVMQHALRLFQGFEQLSNELGEYSKGVKGSVRLWANMSALTEFLPSALASFLKVNPEIQVEVEEQLSGDIVKALMDGIADIGVFAEGPNTSGLETKVMGSDELVITCCKTHPLSKRKSISFEECLQYDFVGLNRGSSLLELTSRSAEKLGKQMRLRIQVRSYDAMCQMIAVNLGVGVLPYQACAAQIKAMGLKVIPLEDAWAKRNLLVATKADINHSPATRLLSQHLVG